ncbi:PhoH family protein [Collinsella sp. AGMB00827]|uniref:PhoH-like protein n=1 Tax=Collinsella ureilytica TaxID=2869515 RepID=A0ABS7MKT0_9ACTN|nr:PhoH family protein [Collinsella urealyticum]
MDVTTVRLHIPTGIDPADITGPHDAVLRALEAQTDASLVVRGSDIVISGMTDEVETLYRLFTQLFQSAKDSTPIAPDDAVLLLGDIRAHESFAAGQADDVLLTFRGRAIRPKTLGQRRYVEAIRSHTITFCTGPAGTGKTYLAMAMALGALKRREVGKIVLTRPVVEAGESLGFLPGTLEEKIDPYIRPLLDALFDLTDRERAQEQLERGMIEIAPLAYMRGRTLNDAFVILDEAQNTTPEQMRMFLTRLGFNSSFIVNGDTSQRDLPGSVSGLSGIDKILSGLDDIAFVELGRSDVVRHRLVGQIVEAYDAFDARQESSTGRARRRP